MIRLMFHLRRNHRLWRKVYRGDLCNYTHPGFFCSRAKAHKGSCALRPRWWNLREVARYKKIYKL